MSNSIILTADQHFHNHTQFGGPRVSEGLSVYDEIGDYRFPGCNRRALALLNATEDMFKYAVENSVKDLFFLGDVFHTKSHVPVSIQNAVSKVFTEASDRGLKLHLFPGNHDLAGKSDQWTSLHSLFTIPNVTVTQAPEIGVIEVGSYALAVATIPYMASKATFLKALEAMAFASRAVKADGVTHSILLMHTSIDGAVTGPHEYIMREGILPSELPFDSFDGLFSGHYHKHQGIDTKRGRLVYVGGLAQHNFGERDYTPGFLKVTLLPDARLRFDQIENTKSPRFHQVEIETEDQLRELLAMFGSEESNDYCRVIWQGGRLPDVKVPDRVTIDTGAVPMESKPRMTVSLTKDSPQELVKRYVDYKAPKHLDRERLIKMGMELL